MPPDSVMMRLSFLSHSDSSFSTFSMWAGLGGLPNRPRLKDSCAGAAACSGVPQNPHSRNFGGFSSPQFVQVIMAPTSLDTGPEIV